MNKKWECYAIDEKKTKYIIEKYKQYAFYSQKN